jgi:hypothetical protein
MTRRLVLRLATALASAGCMQTTPLEPLPAGGHHVLFIGNSLTYVNDLPRTLAQIAAQSGDTIRVASVAEPDYALIDHITNHSGAVEAVKAGGWEYVVLQQGPSTLPVNRDSLILWSKMWDTMIRDVGARPALYMVWPTIDRFEFFDEVRKSYQMAAEAVHGLFLPAGQAWITAWKSDSTLRLYSGDGLHPSSLGTFLAALVMYEQITGKDARALPPKVLVAGQVLGFPEATARLLQQAAHDTNVQYALP